MKAKLSIFLVIIVILSACANPFYNNNSLVGDWGYNGVKVYSFTNDGVFITYAGYTSISYSYTASEGEGEYWLGSYDAVSVPFTYKISSGKLYFTIYGSLTLTLNRLS